MKNLQETVTDLEHDVEELSKLLAQATRVNVKNLLSREIAQFQDALKQVSTIYFVFIFINLTQTNINSPFCILLKEKSKLQVPVVENTSEGATNGQTEQRRADPSDNLSYTSIMKYSFEQEGDTVKYWIENYQAKKKKKKDF